MVYKALSDTPAFNTSGLRGQVRALLWVPVLAAQDTPLSFVCAAWS